ncbi:hypothetical protein ACFC01_13625 [Streptomyces mirabilis]|uniref:hypothetical protein n=1 Tax=Streptomyces mirabilis TaxID=68239 RepID=UPI00224F3F96|nr:hypothetical protein [Streptomyces mirabilis]MCX4608919.1 hypothetical protein [Streptomyces mirabilis]
MKPGDGTAAKRPTGKEHFKDKRLGQDSTSREILHGLVKGQLAAPGVALDLLPLTVPAAARANSTEPPASSSAPLAPA